MSEQIRQILEDYWQEFLALEREEVSYETNYSYSKLTNLEEDSIINEFFDSCYEKEIKEQDELLISNITNPNSIYIKGQLKFSGYNKISVHCYVDTGASTCLASKYIIPPSHDNS